MYCNMTLESVQKKDEEISESILSRLSDELVLKLWRPVAQVLAQKRTGGGDATLGHDKGTLHSSILWLLTKIRHNSIAVFRGITEVV